MGKIRLVFARNRGIGSILIRLGTWSKWSHVAVIQEDEDGVDWVIESRAWYGVRKIRLPEFLDHYTAVAYRNIDVPDPEKGLEWINAQIGKPYDYLGVLGLGFDREWNQDDAWWCSELSESCIQEANRVRFVNDVKRITPQHVWMVA